MGAWFMRCVSGIQNERFRRKFDKRRSGLGRAMFYVREGKVVFHQTDVENVRYLEGFASRYQWLGDSGALFLRIPRTGDT